MKLRYIPYDAIIYLIVLFGGYILGGYLLALYKVNYFILIGNCIATLRLSQTGSSSITLAIAWISIWFWGSAFAWATPLSLGAMNAQKVASLLLLCWTLAISIVFLLAFAQPRMSALGLDKDRSTYGLIFISWGAMAIGWYIYQWISA